MRKIIAAFALVFASATVAQTPAPTTLTFDPPILSFTAVVGGPAFEATVQITNNTGQNFIIESIETSGYPPFSYVHGTCVEQQVPGNTCEVTVGFEPTSTGTITGALNFYSDANLQGGTVSATLPLVGVATAAIPRNRGHWKSWRLIGHAEVQ